MKPANGWRRLCGWKEALKSRGEIFHKPGQNLEAETRTRESPERWRWREQKVGRSESKLGLIFVGVEKGQEQRVPDTVSLLQMVFWANFSTRSALFCCRQGTGGEKWSEQRYILLSTGSGLVLPVLCRWTSSASLLTQQPELLIFSAALKDNTDEKVALVSATDHPPPAARSQANRYF